MLVTSDLSKQEKETLVKISCCIYYAGKIGFEKADWYSEMNGKFYDCHIRPLMEKLYSISCTYEPIND